MGKKKRPPFVTKIIDIYAWDFSNFSIKCVHSKLALVVATCLTRCMDIFAA